MVKTKSKPILEEAAEIIEGARREDYGPVEKSFERIALVWSVVLGIKVTTRQVGQCMIGMKLCRDANKPSRDSLVDICGYAALIEKL